MTTLTMLVHSELFFVSLLSVLVSEFIMSLLTSLSSLQMTLSRFTREKRAGVSETHISGWTIYLHLSMQTE